MSNSINSAKKNPLRIVLITLGSIVAAILLCAIAYFLYVFLSYKRLDDKLALEAQRNSDTMELVEAQKEYSIVTYNIGFGAYEQDFSFFMDGGKSSWAKSKESVIADVTGAAKDVKALGCDFMFIQEIDVDGTRSYHVNQLDIVSDVFSGYSYTFAQNYDSPFLAYPFNQPHGKNKAGLATFSSCKIGSAIRRSLPISDSFSKLLDLDRCYAITRLPMDNGKELCLYNLHLSAYGVDASIQAAQIAMLTADFQADLDKGNYIICGGDYNHNLRESGDANVPSWAVLFPRERLPKGVHIALADAQKEKTAHNTCRNADSPYDPLTAFTVTLDGFIVSDNIEVTDYENVDWQYKYSDHDPVLMRFILRDNR